MLEVLLRDTHFTSHTSRRGYFSIDRERRRGLLVENRECGQCCPHRRICEIAYLLPLLIPPRLARLILLQAGLDILRHGCITL